VQGANIVGGILLSRLLSPREFGFFAIVTFLLAFLNTFGGTGFAANLIRQSREPTGSDISSVFTVQQIVVALMAIAIWVTSPVFATMYGLPQGGAWVFRLLAPALIATSLMVIPQVTLERNLEFSGLAAIEGTQAVVFNASAVIAAANGLGPLSFSLALLLRALAGAILANLIQPWPIRLSLEIQVARRHLAFGLPFQGIGAISLLKDSITPIFVGLFLGVGQVGLVNWATMVSGYVVMALMIFGRLYMPAFARLQHQPERLGHFVERVIATTNAITAPIAMIMLVLFDPITHHVFGDKWFVAAPLFYLLWIGNLVVPTSTPLMGLLNALGKSRTAFGFAVMWMAGTWILGLPLISLFGVLGFGLATLGVQATNLILFRVAQRAVPFRVVAVVGRFWVLAGMLALPLAGQSHASTDVIPNCIACGRPIRLRIYWKFGYQPSGRHTTGAFHD